jgi:Xaa-Pro dipeptidase
MKVLDVVEPEILRSRYPAKEHARKVAKYIIENGGKLNGLIYLEAQKLRYNEDNDQEACFR